MYPSKKMFLKNERITNVDQNLILTTDFENFNIAM